MDFRNLSRCGVLAAVLTLIVSGMASGEVTIKSKAKEIKLTGRQHTQFNTTSVEGELGSEFLIRRARIAVELKLNDFVSGKVQPDFAGGKTTLKDAYIKLNLSPNFQLVTGQFKRPFDLFELTSSTQTLVVERAGKIRGASGLSSLSSMTEGLDYSDRDTGVMAKLKSSSGQFGLDVAVTNGLGANAVPSKVDGAIGEKQFTGRVKIKPSSDQDLVFAAGITALPIAQPDADTTVAVVDLDVEYATAFEVSAEYGNFTEGIHVQAGGIFGDNWDEDPTDRPSFVSLQGIGGYKVPLSGDKVTAIEPVVRVSWSDPNRDMDDDAGILVTPGLQLFFVGRNKMALNVDVFVPQSSDLDTEYSIKAQSFVHF